MPDPGRRPVAHTVDPGSARELDVPGASVRVLVGPDPQDVEPCILLGTILPGGIAPLHSHPDPETFIPVAGELEGLRVNGEDFEWVVLRPGDIFHVPSGARHAFRNSGAEPAISYIVTTARLGRFFAEVAGALADAPRDQAVSRFLEIAENYGHWSGAPEENAAVGLRLPRP